MAQVLIEMVGHDPDTFVIEMATGLGSLVMHLAVPQSDQSGHTLSEQKRADIARLRARAMAIELLANTSTSLNFLN